MKLTEQQLAKLFKQNKNTSIDADVDNLLNATAASDKRINDAEKIANNSQLSAGYQVINQLQNWSQDVSYDLDSINSKPKFTEVILNWLKPSLATAAIATTVYFMVPTMNQEVNLATPIVQTQQSDNPVFSGDFEKNKTNSLPSIPKSDVIYNGSFG